MHLHHIIARSRGGTDDYVEWKSEYEHAYDHALDLVLFPEIAPMVDFRQPGWKLLPKDLQQACLKAAGERMRQNRPWTKRKYRSDVREKKEEIIEAYLKGDSTVTIAERYNTSARCINNYLIEWGIPKRSTSRKGRPDKNPRKTDGYFRKH